MRPFLAVISKSPDLLAQFERAYEAFLNPIYLGPGSHVYARHRLPVLPVGDKGGVVLGPLFRRGDQPAGRIGVLSEKEIEAIGSSKGQVLIDRYWGGYVAILDGEDGVHILRDPSGHTPCYYMAVPGGAIICSDIETLAQCGLPLPDLDLEFLPAFLFSTDFRTERTGFRGFRELLPGHCMRVDANEFQIRQCWSPWDYVSAESWRHTPSADRQSQLRSVIMNVTQSWASSYQHVGLGLSGGLDSSVVAASLSMGATPWTAVTVATQDTEGDERIYAQSVAQALRIPLVEVFHQVSSIDLTRPSVTHLPRPLGNGLMQSMTAIIREVQAENGIDAYFTGRGGDNIFCYIQSATPLVDRVLAEGVGGGTWRTLNDICRLTGASYGEVLKMAVEKIATNRGSYPWKGTQGFLDAATFDPWRHSFNHLWLDAPRNTLPGKAVNIAMFMRLQGTLDGLSFYDDIETVCPLYSQPAMEFCLGVPTWAWCEDGQNRFPVRNAFRSFLPPEIVRRRTKGGPDGFVIGLIEDQKHLISELLLDGTLVSHRIIDRGKLHKALWGDDMIQAPNHMLLAALLEAEVWLNFWSDRLRNNKGRFAA